MSFVKVKSGDTRPLDAVLTANQQPVKLVGGASVRFHMVDQVTGAVVIDRDAPILDALKGSVRWPVQPGDLIPGLYKAEFEVTFADGTVETFPNGEYITIQVLPELA